jgi:hypothetical protein
MHLLPPEVLAHVLSWWRTPAIARTCRLLWREIHAAWYAEHARQFFWRRTLRSIGEVPLEADYPLEFARRLRQFLAVVPPILAQTTEAFAGALENTFTRWMLFRYWAHDVFGDVPLPAAARILMGRWSSHANRLAFSANMTHSDSLLEWWAFCQYWRSIGSAFGAGPREREPFEVACDQAMTAEQRAFSTCAFAFVQFTPR